MMKDYRFPNEFQKLGQAQARTMMQRKANNLPLTVGTGITKGTICLLKFRDIFEL